MEFERNAIEDRAGQPIIGFASGIDNNESGFGKVLIAQGGGPTAVINESLVGAVLEARKFPQITKIYGALNGVEGILNEDFIDLTQETTANLELVAQTPSSALLSTRMKPTEEDCRKMLKVMMAHDIRYFYYIGGNDSSDTLRILKNYAELEKYELKTVHIPKTVDNDLVENDHTPGYGSAARFVASAFTSVNLDNKALSGVYIGVVMGRNAGFLTAASSLAKKFSDDGPHLIYIPERAFSVDKFLSDVEKVYNKLGRCIIAVSEGIQDENGRLIQEILVEGQIESDQHGNIQLSGSGALADMLSNEVKTKLNIKRVRADTFGYLQRSFVECISDVDQMEAREVGEKAVHFSLWNDQEGTVVIRRTGDYSVDYDILPVEAVARKTKVMPDEFINSEGNYVTDAFKHYAMPLIGSNFHTSYRLRGTRVQKILNK